MHKAWSLLKINAVVLDKTGTITEGKPEVTNILWTEENENARTTLLRLKINLNILRQKPFKIP